jgi:hypothetical protein
MFSLGRIIGYDIEMKNIEENSDFESESDDDTRTNFLDCILFENSCVKYYKTNIQKFVNHIEIWAGQRQLNNDHVKSLARQFTREGHVIGTFKLVRSNMNEIRLIDGQHRYFALVEILKIQPTFNCDIILELYETDRLESPATYRLFEKANNVLNVKPEDMANKNALSIVDKLSTNFKGIFKDVQEEKRCNRPEINKRILFDKLKVAFQEYDIDEESLYQRILEYNDQLKTMEIDLGIRSINRCKEIGCYLGFIKDCLWLDEILSIY